MSIEVPAISGVNTQLIMLVIFQNKGIEIAVNATPYKNKDWQWDVANDIYKE